MAMKPLRPCRHPGCPALTREGYCPKHKPKRAERRASAEYHGWYNLPVWTDDLRPAQLLREPGAGSVPGMVFAPWPPWWTMSRPIGETGSCSSTRPTIRACASAAMTGRRRGNRRKNGGNGWDREGIRWREATSAPERVGARTPGHAQGKPSAWRGARVKKVLGPLAQDLAAPRM